MAYLRRSYLETTPFSYKSIFQKYIRPRPPDRFTSFNNDTKTRRESILVSKIEGFRKKNRKPELL